MNEEITDGFHTMDELYEFRKVLSALVFNGWSNAGLFNVHKSKRHSDGELCFGGGWFIIVADTEHGQITFHYDLKDWDLFEMPEKETASPFDGHTSEDALKRLYKLI